jgi:proton-translocating NADH-quinone oxidoreductase chain N
VNYNLVYILPELILAVGGILALIAGLGARAQTTPRRLGVFSPEIVSLVVLVAAFIPTCLLLGHRYEYALSGIPQFTMRGASSGMMVFDGLALALKIIAIISTGAVILLSIDYFKTARLHRGEFYGLLLFATLAITTLAASTDLIMIYLSLEFLSITSYVLTGYLKRDLRSNEAAVKYFIYGSVAAAVMIYGMSILYGITGTTNIFSIAQALRLQSVAMRPLIFISTLLILVGFGFKVALVPFHQWAPDTYEGAPTPITTFLSVGSKAAGFAVLIRVLATGIPITGTFNWTPIIIGLSAITMTYGNLVALVQTNAKRMLAYSSIAHAGYLLLGVATLGVATDFDGRSSAVQAILIYLFAYMLMNLGAFAVVTRLGLALKSDDMRRYAGLIRRDPWAAGAMVFFMLSLAGIPPTAGFLGKFYLFYTAIRASQQTGTSALMWLAVLAIVNTVISVYYYFNIVRIMFFGDAKETAPLPPAGAVNVVIGATLIMTVLVLIFAHPFAHLALRTSAIFSGTWIQ